MSVTLVYDDGQQSRHPRYRIPATVEIDSWRYPVQEWSLDGFAVAGVHDVEALEGPFPAIHLVRQAAVRIHGGERRCVGTDAVTEQPVIAGDHADDRRLQSAPVMMVVAARNRIAGIADLLRDDRG